MSEEVFGMIVLVVFFTLMLGEFTIFCALTLRDTKRQRGNFGIPLKPTVCPNCGSAPLHMLQQVPISWRRWMAVMVVRIDGRLRLRLIPKSWRQSMWDDWTCPECGLELNHWSQPVKEQNSLSKWAILHAAKNAEENERRRDGADERIRDANDQTQRGDAR